MHISLFECHLHILFQIVHLFHFHFSLYALSLAAPSTGTGQDVVYASIPDLRQIAATSSGIASKTHIEGHKKNMLLYEMYIYYSDKTFIFLLGITSHRQSEIGLNINPAYCMCLPQTHLTRIPDPSAQKELDYVIDQYTLHKVIGESTQSYNSSAHYYHSLN